MVVAAGDSTGKGPVDAVAADLPNMCAHPSALLLGMIQALKQHKALTEVLEACHWTW
jgi:hypothetical protein